MLPDEHSPGLKKVRRYDAFIWLDGLDFSNPSKIVTIYSDEGGTAVLHALQEEYGPRAIISVRNDEDANAIRLADQPDIVDSAR